MTRRPGSGGAGCRGARWSAETHRVHLLGITAYQTAVWACFTSAPSAAQTAR